MSYPQYPLDESLEREFCSEFFGEIPESSAMSNFRDCLVQSLGGWSPQTSAAGSSRIASRNAAMALGVGRAAGLIPQLGIAEAFSKVRTSTAPSPKWSSSLAPCISNDTEDQPNSNYALTKNFFQSVTELEMPTAILSQSHPFGAIYSFQQLPATVASSQAPLHTLIHKLDPCTVDMINSSSANHFKEQFTDRSTDRNSLAGPCEANALAIVKTEEEPEIVPVHCGNSCPLQSVCTSSSMLSQIMSSIGERLPYTASAAEDGSFETKSLDFNPNCVSTETAEAGLKKSALRSLDILHSPELTDTSSERADNNDAQAEKSKKAIASTGKRKVSQLEESADCQCGDAHDESIEPKNVASKRGRRSRAAEVHNLSERRRRDRINEKMRALQDLIPNSNKTDKASMLEEVIEYIKMLQLQLQMMSIRSGISISPVLIPARLQRLQPHQMQHVPQMAMGIGTAGFGMIDTVASTSGRPFIPHHSVQLRAAQYCESSPAVASRMTDACNLSPYSSLMDSYNSFISRQQLHLQSQPVHMETYNPYILYQQQLIHRQYAQQLLRLSQQQPIPPSIQQNQSTPLIQNKQHAIKE
ncbi:hypothetical protein O6H91_21G060900 [Diphasiastrum complanatum]|uniref:Uncharacterized protein n=2 Tax=Diphasiastrum complanatum TaxID=34168 RepID=A0ACC2AKZ8_DIPCM|nr:hypothetical protein O6H91_21G060900 [Diphasiastrum complanatum]KAJ7518243.1 hypothetical protein O6H91_21G060900 [Diphasiastrum complanatum]